MSEREEAPSVATCRHCGLVIQCGSVTWWHSDTGISQCDIYADPLPGTIKPGRPADCADAPPCWVASTGPADLCSRHLEEFRAWQAGRSSLAGEQS